MFSVSIDDLLTQVRAERDRMSAALDDAQGPTRDDLEVIVEGDDDGNGRVRALDRYRDYITRSQALIDRYEANGR